MAKYSHRQMRACRPEPRRRSRSFNLLCSAELVTVSCLTELPVNLFDGQAIP
jgi:hypothetical protein